MIKENISGTNQVSTQVFASLVSAVHAQSQVELPRKTISASLATGPTDDLFCGNTSWSVRRRIMAILRKATAVMGPGQKSRIGRLGGSVAIGAVMAGFATPALAQYAAGSGSAFDSSVAIGTGAGSNVIAGVTGVQQVDTDADGTLDYTRNFDLAIGNNARSLGGDSVALGHNVVTNEAFSVGIGTGVTTNGLGAIAIGRNNTADSYAVGTVTTIQSVANRATGVGSVTLGNGAASVTAVAVGIGQNNTIDAAGVAIGSGNTLANTSSSAYALGNANAASGAYSSAIGMGNTASATSAVAIGTVNVASGNTAIAMGRQSTASGQTSIALGNVATANQTNAIAIGHSTQATAAGSIAIGGGNNGASTNLDATAASASGPNAIAIGTNARASGGTTVAVGANAESTIDGLAFGTDAQSTASGAIAVGTSATASAQDATVIGFEIGSSGVNSFVAGNQVTATAAANQTIAILTPGGVSTVSSSDSVIINPENAIRTYSATGVTAVGSGALTTAASATAIGNTSTASGQFSTAVGLNAVASAQSTTALGDNAEANGAFSIAAGLNALSSGQSSVAIGDTAQALADNAIAIGKVTVNDPNAVAIGSSGTSATGQGSVAIGEGQVTNGRGAVAIGDPNVATGTGAVALGADNTANGQGAVAVGNLNTATGIGSLALGDSSNAAATASLALGNNATATGLNSIAQGLNASAGQNNAIAIGANSATTGGSSIAFGVDTDAASTIGGGSGIAIGARAQAVATTAASPISIGANANSSDSDSAVAIGDNAIATGSNAIALGGRNIGGGGSNAAGDYAVAIGARANAAGLNAVAIGGNITTAANAAGANAVAIGSGSSAPNANSVALGANSVAGTPNSGAYTINGGTAAATAPASVVSVGTAGSERQITNVAAGVVSATSTDAINGSQLFTVATAANNLGDSLETVTGGGLVMNVDGTIATPPSISVGGTNYANVTAAIQGADDKMDVLGGDTAAHLGGGATYDPNTGDVTAPAYVLNGTTYNNVGDALDAIAGGAVGPVQYANAGTPTTPNGGTPSQNLTLVGAAAGPVTLDNVAPGSLTAASTQAVNGGQINTGLTSVADALGGGSTFDPVTGEVTAPTYNVAGGTQNSVGDAFDALNTANDTANTGIANAIGGGMAIAPDGTVTAPTIPVNGTNYNNVTDAIAAAGAGYNLIAASTGTGTVSGAASTAIGAGETVTLTAGNNLQATQVGNEVQFALNPVLTDITSLTITGGPALSGTGINMNGDGITGMAAGALTAGSTDAVNGGQINTLGSSVATNLGGGSAFDPATGTVTAPAYSVLGSTYSNVGAAINALDGAVLGVNNGTFGLVQQTGGAPGNGIITIGASTSGTEVSIGGLAGDRQLSGVAAGDIAATSSDAINGGQLFTTNQNTATYLGGGSTVDPATGQVTAPTYNVAGATQNNVGDALGALNTANDTANTGIANVIGGGMAIGPDGTVTNPAFNINGTSYTTVADALQAAGGGYNLTTAATGSGVANGTTVEGVGAGETVTLTAGNNIVTTQVGNEVQVALNSNLTGIDSITLNNGSITGLAPGSTAAGSTDAVNGSQINTGLGSVATSFGGGSTYDPVTGTVTAPSYTIQGSGYTNVGDALGAVDSNLTNVLNGTAGLVQQTGGAPGTGQITVGAATGGTSLSVAGTDGNRTVTGVAPASLAPTSTDAVNGGQINTLANSAATALGGGSSFDPATGTLTAPSINVGGTSYNNVTAAIEAGDDKADEGLSDVASALGGGATYDPATGSITQPAYMLGGNTYNNVGSALGALSNGAVGPVQYSNAATPTTPNGGTPTNNLTLVGAAAGPVTLSNVAPASLAPTSTDAVNGSQLNTGLTSVATGLGGGSTFNQATGQVTPPTYTVAGGTQNSVGAALDALDDKAMAIGSGLAAALGGGAVMAPDGTITAPAYNIQGATYSNVGAALGGLDTAVTNLANGTAGLVQQAGGAPGAGPITVGAGTGGTVVNMAGTDGNRRVTGVAPGALTPTSTDAVNGGQLNGVGASTAAALGGGSTFDPATGRVTAPSYTVGGATYNNAGDAFAAQGRIGVQYVPDANGNPTNAVQLSGANNGQPVIVRNLAPGAVAAGSTDAVNGGQLFSVQQVADAGVQYVRRPDGTLDRSTLTLGTPGAPTQIRNLAPGIAPTDAANVGQLQSGLASGLASANAYTDGRIAGIAFDLGKVAKRAYAGTASALALQPPALFEPGQVVMRGGVGAYRGEWALGLAVRATADNGRWSLSGGISGGPNSGVAASAGIDFVLGD